MTSLITVKEWLQLADSVIVLAGNEFAQQEGLDLKQMMQLSEVPIAQAWPRWQKLIAARQNYQPSTGMQALTTLLSGRDYFVATTTFAHLFETAGLASARIFNLNGDWTKLQCTSGMNHGHPETAQVLVQAAAGAMSLPKCEVCGQPLEPNLPFDSHFFPDTDANQRFRWFLMGHETNRVVILALGIDASSQQLLSTMLPLVQQFPTWQAAVSGTIAIPKATRVVSLSGGLTDNLQALVARSDR